MLSAQTFCPSAAQFPPFEVSLRQNINYKAGLPAQAFALRLCLPMCTHSGIKKPELAFYGGGPARDLHPFPYSPDQLNASGTL